MSKEYRHHEGVLISFQIDIQIHKLNWVKGDQVVTGEGCQSPGAANTVFEVIVAITFIIADGGVIRTLGHPGNTLL